MRDFFYAPAFMYLLYVGGNTTKKKKGGYFINKATKHTLCGAFLIQTALFKSNICLLKFCSARILKSSIRSLAAHRISLFFSRKNGKKVFFNIFLFFFLISFSFRMFLSYTNLLSLSLFSYFFSLFTFCSSYWRRTTRFLLYEKHWR